MTFKRILFKKLVVLSAGMLLSLASWAQSGIIRDNKVNLKVSPNPVVSTLNVELLNDIQSGNITVVNVIGTVVASAQAKNGAAAVDMKAMPPGLYYVKFTDGTNTGFIKVVKQ